MCGLPWKGRFRTPSGGATLSSCPPAHTRWGGNRLHHWEAHLRAWARLCHLPDSPQGSPLPRALGCFLESQLRQPL